MDRAISAFAQAAAEIAKLLVGREDRLVMMFVSMLSVSIALVGNMMTSAANINFFGVRLGAVEIVFSIGIYALFFSLLYIGIAELSSALWNYFERKNRVKLDMMTDAKIRKLEAILDSIPEDVIRAYANSGEIGQDEESDSKPLGSSAAG